MLSTVVIFNFLVIVWCIVISLCGVSSLEFNSVSIRCPLLRTIVILLTMCGVLRWSGGFTLPWEVGSSFNAGSSF
jgi:hypothetical protein